MSGPTSDELRSAADVLNKLAKDQPPGTKWEACELREVADRIDALDAEAREVRHLARVIAADPDLAGGYADNGAAYWKVARSIIAAGWTRGDSR